MLVVIDNYDSFTYNLVQYLGELGAEMEIYRNDKITVDELERRQPAGMLISPGPCTPSEAGISVETVQRFSGRVPLLGVCLGHQSIGQAFGGVVKRAPILMHGKTSEIEHNGEGLFAGMPAPFTATRYHSLIVERETLPAELMETARADTGEIMALRHREHPTFGVQFHPESILTPDGKTLLRNFLALLS